MVGIFNTPIPVIDTKTREKIDKDIQDLSNTINQLELKTSKQHRNQSQKNMYSLAHSEYSPG